mgnify:CR=1 FL=1
MSAYHLSALLVAWAVLRWSRHRSLFPPLIVCCVVSIIGISLTHSLTLHLSNYLSLSLSLTRSPNHSLILSNSYYLSASQSIHQPTALFIPLPID